MLDKLILGQADLERGACGNLPSPARRRQWVDHRPAELGISERRAGAGAGQSLNPAPETPQRPRGRDEEAALTAAIIRLASQYVGISERRAGAGAGQSLNPAPETPQRPRGRDEEAALTAAIIRLASQYGRDG